MARFLIFHVVSLAAMGVVCFVGGMFVCRSRLRDAQVLAEDNRWTERRILARMDEIDRAARPVLPARQRFQPHTSTLRPAGQPTPAAAPQAVIPWQDKVFILALPARELVKA